MKANHNTDWLSSSNKSAVFNMSKIQIWKRITTIVRLSVFIRKLYLICQRYKFESESQRNGYECARQLAVFNMSKIQIWKRITTSSVNVAHWSWLYLICQRYKFESESQPEIVWQHQIPAVFNMSKIQIWKRITTRVMLICPSPRLYLICQRYKFESESQHYVYLPAMTSSCI